MGVVIPLVAKGDADFVTKATAYHKLVELKDAQDDSGVPKWGVKLFVHKPATAQVRAHIDC